MTAAGSVNGLPVASTTGTPGGISRRNSPAGTGSVPMPLSSYHDAGRSPANEISRSRHPSSASTIASAGKDGSGAGCQPSPSEDTLSWYARRPRELTSAPPDSRHPSSQDEATTVAMARDSGEAGPTLIWAANTTPRGSP